MKSETKSSLACTMELPAFEVDFQAFECHDAHQQYLTNASRECDLRTTMELPAMEEVA